MNQVHLATGTEFDAKSVDSVMQTAIATDLDGIIGECGGSMMCATCHCYVDEDWTETVGGPSDGEANLLDGAASEDRVTSRLSWQIKVSPESVGPVACLPESQI